MAAPVEALVSGAFAAATAVAQASDRAWSAEIPPGWDVLGAVDGGVLLAIAGRAMRAATGREPVTLTAHYLAPGRTGPLEVDVDILRSGRTFTTARAVLRQGDRAVTALLGTFGDLSVDPDVLIQERQPPAWPDPDTLPRLVAPNEEGFPPAFVNRVDLRVHPADAGFYEGRPSGRPVMRAYLRLLDDEPIDAVGVLLAADSLPPPTFNSHLPVNWTPTIELTTHVRAVPAPGWLRIDTATRFVSHGRLEVDGVIWDSADRVVVQMRQLALVPRAASS